jgi:hypothetical protein
MTEDDSIHIRFTHSERAFREVVVFGDRAVYQSEDAKTYQCPECLRPIPTTYEGKDVPTVTCIGGGNHVVRWTGPEVM